MKSHVGLIIRDGHRVLFIQRAASKKTLPNIWSFPSGTVEAGETLAQTAIREAKEELGIKVKVEKELAAIDLVEFGVCLHFMIVEIKNGQPQILEPNEIQAIRWFTFPEFFKEFRDDQIGHGLIWLRKNPRIWQADFI